MINETLFNATSLTELWLFCNQDHEHRLPPYREAKLVCSSPKARRSLGSCCLATHTLAQVCNASMRVQFTFLWLPKNAAIGATHLPSHMPRLSLSPSLSESQILKSRKSLLAHLPPVEVFLLCNINAFPVLEKSTSCLGPTGDSGEAPIFTF